MKKVLKQIFLWIISFDFMGVLIKKLSSNIWKISFQRKLIERKRNEGASFEFINSLFTDKRVLNGPFKDLLYPEMRSKSSSLYSKLIGSYEKELEPLMEQIVDAKYPQIIDIGCAEGYYAVGLALKNTNTKVYAFDIDPEARELTKKMAKVNKVSERVVVEKNCDKQYLKNFNYDKKTLIISDIEGAEKDLFDEEIVQNLKNVDLLIETHDWVDINISTNLEKLFQPTHKIEVISSIGDVQKAKYYNYKELEGQSLQLKYRVFEEGRSFNDEWLWIKSIG